MENTNLIKPYEISIWGFQKKRKSLTKEEITEPLLSMRRKQKRDVFKSKIENTTSDYEDFKVINPDGIPSYYDEYKIAIIGSNTMTALSRACEPHFERKTTGENTLTFTLYTKYWDSDACAFVDNPFIKYLTNERVVKLKYEDKWYDFVIKQIVESSDKKSYRYTAKDRFIAELGKNGFNLEFDKELENNQGTITYLANKALEGSAWTVDEKSDLIQQTKVEPLYIGKLNTSITARNLENDELLVIPDGKQILLFYSQLSANSNFVQFLYSEDGYVTDEDRIIISNKHGNPIPNYYIESVTYQQNEDGSFSFVPNFVDSVSYSDRYRGRRIVRQQLSGYDSFLDKYISKYEKNGVEYNCYSESEYVTDELVRDIICNGKDFKNSSGWQAGAKQIISPTMIYSGDNGLDYAQNVTEIDWGKIASEWESEESTIDSDYFAGLKIHFNNKPVFNTGIKNNKEIVKGIVSGEEYMVRIKYYESNAEKGQDGQGLIRPEYSNLILGISEYGYDDNYNYIEKNNYTAQGSWFKDDLEYWNCVLTFNSSITEDELGKKKIGLKVLNDKDICIYEIQLFKLMLDQNGEIIIPGKQIIQSNVLSIYNLYIPGKTIGLKEKEQFIPDYRLSGDEFVLEANGFYPKYDKSFEKIRSIDIKESNRFNILQKLCETFECWVEFNVKHEENGKIWRDRLGRPEKKVRFKQYVGKENFSGFKYGVNLSSMQRTVDSNQIVTKIIVKNNTNEFGKNSFCSIARASENPIKENFILNFDHYIHSGLIDEAQLNRDLYEHPNNQIKINYSTADEEAIVVNTYDRSVCYYHKLAEINSNREALIEELALWKSDKDVVDSDLFIADQIIQEAEEQIAELKQNFQEAYTEISGFMSYISGDYSPKSLELVTLYEAAKSDEACRKICQEIIVLKAKIVEYSKLKEDLDIRQKEVDKKIAQIEESLNKILEEKNELNLEFFEKYSDFIQEGSWISEDYYDDNLYYLDAENVLYGQARPKITYTINVVEISGLPGYEGYKIDIGDRTFMEDTEFFGYVYEDGIKTPYKEKIVVTQIDNSLDEPSKDKITVKNYKNQFEDLFQTITATVQSLQYHEGEYARAAAIVSPDSQINGDSLADAMENNDFNISNSKAKSLQWGKNGFINKNLYRPNEILKMVGGALYLSKDGGDTWGTAITGEGINASYIKTGALDTSIIRITDGANICFGWDKDGLTAYAKKIVDEDNYKKFIPDADNYVRFNKYGLYGKSSGKLADIFGNKQEREEFNSLKKDASFALLWDGLYLNFIDQGIQINKEGFVVSEPIDEGARANRLKIGKIGNDTYGMQLYDIEIDAETGKAKSIPILTQTGDGILIGQEEDENEYLKLSKGSITAHFQHGILKSTDEVGYMIPISVFEDDKTKHSGFIITSEENEEFMFNKFFVADGAGGVRNYSTGLNNNEFSNNFIQIHTLKTITDNGTIYMAPGFLIGSTGSNEYGQKNRAMIYGNAIGGYDVNSGAPVYNENRNRGYLNLSYYSPGIEGMADSNTIVTRIVLDYQGINLSYIKNNTSTTFTFNDTTLTRLAELLK